MIKIGAGKLAPQNSVESAKAQQTGKKEKPRKSSKEEQVGSFSSVFEQYLSTQETGGMKNDRAEKTSKKQRSETLKNSALRTSRGLLRAKKRLLRSSAFRFSRFVTTKKRVPRGKNQTIEQKKSAVQPTVRKTGRSLAALKKRGYVLLRYQEPDREQKASAKAALRSFKDQTHLQASAQKQKPKPEKEVSADAASNRKRWIAEKQLKRMVKESQLSLKAEQQRTGKSSGGLFENTNAGEHERSLGLALSRYENNVQRVRFSGDYQIQKNADEIFNQIVKQMNITLSKGGGEARLVVKPEFLGTLRLNVQLQHSEVNASIGVDNQIVKDLIMSRFNLLEESLMQQGFSLGSLQVEVREKETGLNSAQQEKTEKTNRMERESEESDQPVLYAEVPWISAFVNITV